jgi:hypothetical protein
MACTAMAMWPWPVTRITGSSGSAWCSSGSHSVPLMPGRRTSLTTMAGTPKLMCARARSALGKDSTSNPARVSTWVVLARTSSSSSTSITRMAGASLT